MVANFAGTCVVIDDDDFGIFGVCMGTPKAGIPCNDYEECTNEDKCVVVKTDDGDEMGLCMGTFAGPIPCNDYDFQCTSDDKCALVRSASFLCWVGLFLSPLSNQFEPTDSVTACRCKLVSASTGSFTTCAGTPNTGQSCDDYEECTENDVCTDYEPRFPGGATVTCTGTVADKTCDDYDQCTDNDRCMQIGDNDYGGFVTCKGDVIEGKACNDYSQCTEKPVCVKTDYGDYAFCQGTPTVGNSCGTRVCEGGGTCVASDYGYYSVCVGAEPLDGVSCDTGEECNIDGVCVRFNDGSGDVSFCRGTPAVGKPCDDYNDCTTDDACFFGYADYAFCGGTPVAQGTPCDDDNDSTTNDVCVGGDYSAAFCRGE